LSLFGQNKPNLGYCVGELKFKHVFTGKIVLIFLENIAHLKFRFALKKEELRLRVPFSFWCFAFDCNKDRSDDCR
jgi:hypothetical protein